MSIHNAEQPASGQPSGSTRPRAIPGVPVMRYAVTLAALAVLLIVPAGTAAVDSSRTSDAPAVVDARHASLLDRTPVIQTDARHAALVIRAGARPRIVQPKTASDLDRAMPVRGSTVHRGVAWLAGIGAATALLILGGGAVVLARRRKHVVA